MKREKFGVVWTMRAALVLVGLALAGTAWGDGREFSGFYRVSDVSVSGDTASLTLTLRLFNHSGRIECDGDVARLDHSEPELRHVPECRRACRTQRAAQRNLSDSSTRIPELAARPAAILND